MCTWQYNEHIFSKAFTQQYKFPHCLRFRQFLLCYLSCCTYFVLPQRRFSNRVGGGERTVCDAACNIAELDVVMVDTDGTITAIWDASRSPTNGRFILLSPMICYPLSYLFLVDFHGFSVVFLLVSSLKMRIFLLYIWYIIYVFFFMHWVTNYNILRIRI